jgi:hypothetical protein
MGIPRIVRNKSGTYDSAAVLHPHLVAIKLG